MIYGVTNSTIYTNIFLYIHIWSDLRRKSWRSVSQWTWRGRFLRARSYGPQTTQTSARACPDWCSVLRWSTRPCCNLGDKHSPAFEGPEKISSTCFKYLVLLEVFEFGYLFAGRSLLYDFSPVKTVLFSLQDPQDQNDRGRKSSKKLHGDFLSQLSNSFLKDIQVRETSNLFEKSLREKRDFNLKKSPLGTLETWIHSSPKTKNLFLKHLNTCSREAPNTC